MIVVDNASRTDDHRRIEALLEPRVRLVRNTENLGYALANNQGFHVARGRFHAVVNPDARVVPGCLQALLDALAGLPAAAIVGPLATMDADGRVLMPPNDLPDPYLDQITALARAWPGVARWNARRRARFADSYWTAREPQRLPMLSGAFFLGARTTFEEHGLFDPGYPLYYEDTDLFRRYHERDLGLWHVPAARIVHHFSRSALGRLKAALYRHTIGARRYFRTWFGEAGLRAHLTAEARATALSAADRVPFTLRDVPAGADPPTLVIPDRPGTFLEVAGNPHFTLGVGIYPGTGGDFTIPAGFWDDLAPTSYWCRAVAPPDYETLTAWRVTKCPRT